jgi:EpsI family protein
MKMSKKVRPVLIILFVSGVIAWTLYFRVYHQSDTVNINNFPTTIGEWSSKDLPISDYDLSILETRNAFVREYSNPQGQHIYLYTVYSQNNRKVSHPPEICYTGSGATIVSSVPDFFEGKDKAKIDVNRLVVEKGAESQIVLYWFKVGNTFTSNYWKQQSLIAINTLLGKPSSNALIRLSINIPSSGIDDGVSELKKFASLLLPTFIQYLP